MLLIEEGGPKLSIIIPSVSETLSMQTVDIPDFTFFPIACESSSLGFSFVILYSAADTSRLSFSTCTLVRALFRGYEFVVEPFPNGE